MDDTLAGWFRRHPGIREGLMIVLFLVLLYASFFGGYHFRTVDNYVCYSYVGLDGQGRLSDVGMFPNCNPSPSNSSLSCNPGYELLSYGKGAYIGPDPMIEPQNYSSRGYKYFEGDLE